MDGPSLTIRCKSTSHRACILFEPPRSIGATGILWDKQGATEIEKEGAKGVSLINVLVATTSPDVKAEVIAESVAARRDMNLVESRCVSMAEVDTVLKSFCSSSRCVFFLVRATTETTELAQRWLAERD